MKESNNKRSNEVEIRRRTRNDQKVDNIWQGLLSIAKYQATSSVDQRVVKGNMRHKRTDRCNTRCNGDPL